MLDALSDSLSRAGLKSNKLDYRAGDLDFAGALSGFLYPISLGYT